MQCAYDIFEIDISESKKGSKYLLFKNLVRHLNSEEAEAREDGDFEFFKKLHGFFIKNFGSPKKKPNKNQKQNQELADKKIKTEAEIQLENPLPRPQTN